MFNLIKQKTMRISWVQKLSKTEVDDIFGHYPDANFNGSVQQRSGEIIDKWEFIGQYFFRIKSDDGEEVLLKTDEKTYNQTEK